jgi:hypothetical protein
MSDYWREYLKHKRDEYLTSIGTHEMRDGKIVDTTSETIANQRENLAEIEGILAKR